MTRPVQLQIQTLSSRATLPAYQTPGAAGMDLHACLSEGETIVLAVGAIALVPTGLALAIPEGHEGQVRARSGLAAKHGIGLPNGVGTIDSDYRGELRVAVINWGTAPFVIEHGLRVAQLVISPVARAEVRQVEALDQTARGRGGFGSTGLHARA